MSESSSEPKRGGRAAGSTIHNVTESYVSCVEAIGQGKVNYFPINPVAHPCDSMRVAIMCAAACGCTITRMADVLGIKLATLKMHYASEIANGLAMANTMVAQSLFNQAMNGNVQAQMFWLRTQAKWKEPEKETKLTIEQLAQNPEALLKALELAEAAGLDDEVIEAEVVEN